MVITDEPEGPSNEEASTEGQARNGGSGGRHAARGAARSGAWYQRRSHQERSDVGRSDATAAMTATALSAEDDADEDRSLRELFWGED